jgi:hypothetical protein
MLKLFAILPIPMEAVPLLNKRSYTNQCNPQVAVHYIVEDLVVLNQSIAGRLANRKIQFLH